MSGVKSTAGQFEAVASNQNVFFTSSLSSTVKGAEPAENLGKLGAE
jgi:hypothetical protein